ncbi:MAG: hypothetical protein WCS29_07865 [Candidatus Neomarinimicrobiota bacterium]|jgi:hypothetical protein
MSNKQRPPQNGTQQKPALTRNPQSGNPDVIQLPMRGRSEVNRQLCHTAHRRLQTLLEEAENVNLYGLVSIEVGFENGRITTVRRRIDGTDK